MHQRRSELLRKVIAIMRRRLKLKESKLNKEIITINPRRPGTKAQIMAWRYAKFQNLDWNNSRSLSPMTFTAQSNQTRCSRHTTKKSGTGSQRQSFTRVRWTRKLKGPGALLKRLIWGAVTTLWKVQIRIVERIDLIHQLKINLNTKIKFWNQS